MGSWTERLLEPLANDDWSSLRRIRIALAGFAMTIAIGALGYRLFEPGLSLGSSLWLALVTATTVGYGDLVPQTLGGQVTTIIILASGFAFVSLGTASFVEFLVGGQVARVLGRRRLEKNLAELKNHIIVAGYGRMGQLICREVGQSLPIVVIERDQEILRRLTKEGILAIEGDATEEPVLERAGISRAKGLVTVVETDAENVFIVLTAREMNQDLYILARSIDERTERKLIRAGASKVISPYLIGGLRLAQAILRPAVVDFLEFAFNSSALDVHVEEICVSARSELAGVALSQSGISAHNVLVVAIKRAIGSMEFNPSRQTEIAVGDTLICLGPQSGLQTLQERAGG